MKIQAFDFSVNLLRNLIWQYNDAQNLQAVIAQKEQWYTENHEQFWTDWYSDVFNLQTANDFGLSVWAIILGVPLVVTPDPDPDKVPFGFAADDSNFGNSNFAAGANGIGLTTEQKRLVLRLRYFQLITRGAVPEINEFLSFVFGPDQAYVADGLGMTARYVFTPGALPSALEFVLTSYDLLPRPAGVGVDFVVEGEAEGWGFGRYRQNFNNGNFYHGV